MIRLMRKLACVALCAMALPAVAQYVTLAGKVAGANGLPAANNIISLQPTQPFYVAGMSPVLVVPNNAECATSIDGTVVGVPNPLQAPQVNTVFSGSLAAGNYFVKVAWTDAATHITLASPEIQVQLASTGSLKVLGLISNPATSVNLNVYIGTTTGTETLQGSVAVGGTYTQSVALVSGAALPSTNTTLCQVIANDSGWPTGTGYIVSMTTPAGNTQPGYPMQWQLLGAGNVINLGLGLPLYNGVVIYPSPILSSPPNNAPQSISGPLFLWQDPPGGSATALLAADQHYVDTSQMINITSLGSNCYPNSTAAGVMTANVACFAYAISHPGTYFVPAGVWYVNGPVTVSGSAFTSFHLIGAGATATTIQEQADNTPILNWTSTNNSTQLLMNDFSIENIGFNFLNQQAAPANSTTNSVSPAIYFNGANTSSFFRFHINDVVCGNASRCIDLAKTNSVPAAVTQSVWGYDIYRVTGFGTLAGAVVNLRSGGAVGNPRCHMWNIYSTALISEPFISTAQCQELEFTDIEGNNGQNSAIEVTGTQNGRIDGLHLEVWNQTTAGQPLVLAENSNISFGSIDWSGSICPVASGCAAASAPALYFIDDTGGGGTIHADLVQMLEFSSKSDATMWGLRYHTNVVSAKINRFQPIFFTAGVTAGSVEPSSDLGLLTENGTQFADIGLNGAAQLLTLTSVAAPSGGAQVYTGTITGGTNNAYVGAWFLVAGFGTAGNNGFYKCTASTSTTLKLVNTAGGAETLAATATEAVVSVAHNIYERYYNSGTQLANWTYQAVPVWNAVSSKWDSYLNFSTAGMQTGGVSFAMPGWTHIWLRPNDTLDPANQGTTGFMRFWTRDTTNFAVPAITLGRNDGTGNKWVSVDLRTLQDAGGFARFGACLQTNTGQAIGSETMPADAACQFQVDKNGVQYTNGTVSLQSGATGSIGGGALAAGACATGTATIGVSATGHTGTAAANDGSVQGNYTINVSVITTTATVSVCAITAGTPTAKTYNVTVN